MKTGVEVLIFDVNRSRIGVGFCNFGAGLESKSQKKRLRTSLAGIGLAHFSDFHFSGGQLFFGVSSPLVKQS